MSEDKEHKEKAETPNMGFGITKDTKAGNATKMLPPIKIAPTAKFPNGYEFPKASLVNVIAKDEYETKNGKTQVLQFVFRDAEGRQHIRTEWAQDHTDAKYLKKMSSLNERVNHMYLSIYPALPEGGIGTDATSFFDYFQQLEKAFKVNPDLSKIKFYLKLVWFNGNLDFPYSPNFMEKVIKDKPCTLEVNLKYDTVEQTAPSASNIPGVGGASASDDIDFDAEY